MDETGNTNDEEISKKITQINDIFNEKISSFSLDELRECGKDNQMTSVTQYNKQRMKEVLVAEFQKNWDFLKEMKLEELRAYSRENKIGGFSTAKKNELIVLIMTKTAFCEDRQFPTTKFRQSKGDEMVVTEKRKKSEVANS
jgi:hypothetical protein